MNLVMGDRRHRCAGCRWLVVAVAPAVRAKRDVNGSGPDVFAMIAILRRWTTNRFADRTMRFQGPEAGVDATMVAAGKSSGDGVVKITQADPDSGIQYTLDFNHGTQFFTGAIHYSPSADGLRVTWTLDADFGGNPVKRWGGLAMEKLMSGDMDCRI